MVSGESTVMLKFCRISESSLAFLLMILPSRSEMNLTPPLPLLSIVRSMTMPSRYLSG